MNRNIRCNIHTQTQQKYNKAPRLRESRRLVVGLPGAVSYSAVNRRQYT